MNTSLRISANNIKNYFVDIKGRMKQTIAQTTGLDSRAGLPKRRCRFSKVAPIYEQEARQRYWILRRDIEMNIDTSLRKLGGKAEARLNLNRTNHFDAHIAALQKKIYEQSKNKPYLKSKAERAFKLLSYYKILLIYKNVDKRDLDYLTTLWKDLTFVRTRMLSEGVIDADKLPYQLDFCRSEAEYIGAQDDPEVKLMIAQAAENLGLEDAAHTNNKQAVRMIVSLMAKLSDMRIRKLTDQVHKKKTYMALFSILIVLSLLLFSLNDHLINNHADTTKADDAVYALYFETTEIQADTSGQDMNLLSGAWHWGSSAIRFLLRSITAKPTIFIFFAGLAGGFFSALIKFEPNKQAPGDEIFIRWYRLTKPFIGAFGAVVIFIIVSTGLINIEYVSEAIKEEMRSNPVSGFGFTFGFLTGFTERLILPRMN